MRKTLTAMSFAFALTVPAAASVVGGRPSGCPHRYCGCASALYVGLPNSDGRWNLARNWLTLPRAEPGPGMADATRGHVRIIIGGSPGAWQFYDPNSGRGLTRIHTGPIRGVVVNPNGGSTRFAARHPPERYNKREKHRIRMDRTVTQYADLRLHTPQ